MPSFSCAALTAAVSNVHPTTASNFFPIPMVSSLFFSIDSRASGAAGAWGRILNRRPDFRGGLNVFAILGCLIGRVNQVAWTGTFRYKTIKYGRIVTPLAGFMMRCWLVILCKRDLHAGPKSTYRMNPVPDYS